MLTSFSTALSALSADTTAIDVVGNNLANLNTSGFKASTAAFHDLLSQSIGSGATEYTRSGNFQVNSTGNLVTPTNEVLQGWTRSNGVLDTNVPIGPITVPVGSLA